MVDTASIGFVDDDDDECGCNECEDTIRNPCHKSMTCRCGSPPLVVVFRAAAAAAAVLEVVVVVGGFAMPPTAKCVNSCVLMVVVIGCGVMSIIPSTGLSAICNPPVVWIRTPAGETEAT
jgi:hypothetical protein